MFVAGPFWLLCQNYRQVEARCGCITSRTWLRTVAKSLSQRIRHINGDNDAVQRLFWMGGGGGGGRRFVCGMAKVAVNKLRAGRCRRDADAGKAGRLRKSIFVMRSIVVAVTLCMDQHECNLQDKYNFWQSPLNLNYITAKRNDMINLFCHLAIIFLGLMSLPGIVFAVRNL